MDNTQIFSRRQSDQKVDFRPDLGKDSPYGQLRRLSALLELELLPADDVTDCDEGISYLREYAYRKVFTGTTHEQFLATDAAFPEAVDWLLAVAVVDAEHYRNQQKKQQQRRELRSAQ